MAENKAAIAKQIASAVSMESLDNCSTISSGEQQSQVRTLFVSGLPVDAKPRELYLLFRGYSGYEASQLKITSASKNGATKANTLVGFVTFATRQDADEARRKLQGVRFDPDLPQTIRLELARSNTKVTKQPKQPSPPIISPASLPAILPAPAQNGGAALTAQNLAALAALQHQLQQDGGGGALATALNGTVYEQHYPDLTGQQTLMGLQQQLTGNPYVALQQAQVLQQMLANNSSAVLAQQQQQQQHQALAALMAAQQQHLAATTSASNGLGGYGHHHHPQTSNNGYFPQQQQQLSLGNGQTTTPPCSTLFIANLGAQPSEEELKNLFRVFPGFSRVRMHSKGGAPVAFVEYQSVAQAALAMHTLQGRALTSTATLAGGQGGIRIEFAKSKMGDTAAIHHAGSIGGGQIGAITTAV